MSRIWKYMRTPEPMNNNARLVDLLAFILGFVVTAAIKIWVWHSQWEIFIAFFLVIGFTFFTVMKIPTYREEKVQQESDDLDRFLAETPPTYHDIFITAPGIPRTQFSQLPFSLELTCMRTTGWQLWNHGSWGDPILIGGEYEESDKWLVIEVRGEVIVDSRRLHDKAGS